MLDLLNIARYLIDVLAGHGNVNDWLTHLDLYHAHRLFLLGHWIARHVPKG